MIKHILRHLRNNTVAYLALFVALGGTSAYASVSVVSAHTTTQSAKGNGTCLGACPATKVIWAYFGRNVANTAWIPLQTPIGGYNPVLTKTGLGSWTVQFLGQNDLSNCAKFANLTQIRGSATVLAYSSSYPDPSQINVLTTDASGNPVDTGFDVLVTCGGGQGKVTATAPIPDGAGATP